MLQLQITAFHTYIYSLLVDLYRSVKAAFSAADTLQSIAEHPLILHDIDSLLKYDAKFNIVILPHVTTFRLL